MLPLSQLVRDESSDAGFLCGPVEVTTSGVLHPEQRPLRRGEDQIVRTGSDSLCGAVSRLSQALATQIPNRLAERLRVGNLPSG